MAKKPRHTRPMPPEELAYPTGTGDFVPAPEVVDWIHQVFVDKAGLLHNEEHQHLATADMGVLWTNAGCARKGRRVIGMAEMPRIMGNHWHKARQELQIINWFGYMPDFLITLDATWCYQATDLEFCALVEHELYHCAHERDAFGAPKFKRSTGEPVYTIRGHDVEEFVGVVRRYGMGNPDGPLAKLVQAAICEPEVAPLNISHACGTCLQRVA